MIAPRISQSIFMGLVIGSLYFQLGDNDYFNKLGMILYSAISSAFGNMVFLFPLVIFERSRFLSLLKAKM